MSSILRAVVTEDGQLKISLKAHSITKMYNRLFVLKKGSNLFQNRTWILDENYTFRDLSLSPNLNPAGWIMQK